MVMVGWAVPTNEAFGHPLVGTAHPTKLIVPGIWFV